MTAQPRNEAMRPVKDPGPRVASQRELLRRGMPTLYRDDDFATRFLSALETVLDPLLAMVDGLSAHFDVRLAPDDVLELLAAWLGFELDESLSEERRRLVVRQGCRLARRQGTHSGIELALHLSFPGLPIEVEDGGRTAGGLRPEDLAPPGSGQLVVRCNAPIPTETAAAVARTIEEVKPADVPYRLLLIEVATEEP